VERRTLIGAALLSGLLPRTVNAQPSRVRRIGFLGNANPASGASSLDALRRGLNELGWVDGQTVKFESRWADSQPERLSALLDDYVRNNVDLIVVSGPAAIAAAKRATEAIPVVFVVLVDPVTMGFAQSLARPGGNMTGLGSHFEELVTKQLQLLKETVPKLSRVAFLRRPEGAPVLLAAARAAARSLGITERTFTYAGLSDLESAFKVAHDEHVGAVHVLPSPYISPALRARLFELTTQYRMPACYELRSYVQAGGLMSYGPNIDEMFRRAAGYVDRIFKGASPAELAIERPERFELLINLKTASAIGLTIPPSVLQRADELIQ
jgi:putative tryptophan/tyrosine transport system substrate-binding protein